MFLFLAAWRESDEGKTDAVARTVQVAHHLLPESLLKGRFRCSIGMTAELIPRGGQLAVPSEAELAA